MEQISPLYKAIGGGVKIFSSPKHNLVQQFPYSPPTHGSPKTRTSSAPRSRATRPRAASTSPSARASPTPPSPPSPPPPHPPPRRRPLPLLGLRRRGPRRARRGVPGPRRPRPLQRGAPRRRRRRRGGGAGHEPPEALPLALQAAHRRRPRMRRRRVPRPQGPLPQVVPRGHGPGAPPPRPQVHQTHQPGSLLHYGERPRPFHLRQGFRFIYWLPLLPFRQAFGLRYRIVPLQCIL
jgi:hypothetical protein